MHLRDAHLRGQPDELRQLVDCFLEAGQPE